MAIAKQQLTCSLTLKNYNKLVELYRIDIDK